MSSGQCGAAGECGMVNQRACAPFICGANACKSDCAASNECVNGAVCIASQCVIPSGLAIVRTSATGPQIKGDAADDVLWALATPVPIQNVVGGSINGASDLSGHFRAMWNDEALFFRIDVTDEARRADSTYPWEDDSPEIYIDADRSRGGKYDGVNDFQYVFLNAEPFKVVEVALKRTDGVVHKFSLLTGGYRLDVKLPWSTLRTAGGAGKTLGLDVHINDDDDGAARDGKLAWFGTVDLAYTRPDLFSQATLVP